MHEEEDPDNFDPMETTRDYGKLADQIKVFCVSSRAFQKLSGRLRNDLTANLGFDNVEETGIPSLRRHAASTTEQSRFLHARHFLSELGRIVQSMALWCHASTDDVIQAEQQLAQQAALVRAKQDHQAVSVVLCLSSNCYNLASSSSLLLLAQLC